MKDAYRITPFESRLKDFGEAQMNNLKVKKLTLPDITGKDPGRTVPRGCSTGCCNVALRQGVDHQFATEAGPPPRSAAVKSGAVDEVGTGDRVGPGTGALRIRRHDDVSERQVFVTSKNKVGETYLADRVASSSSLNILRSSDSFCCCRSFSKHTNSACSIEPTKGGGQK